MVMSRGEVEVVRVLSLSVLFSAWVGRARARASFSRSVAAARLHPPAAVVVVGLFMS